VNKPNIVFIMADDTGYGDVACYSPESKIPTPHIDRLAVEGTMFTDAHSPCALCTPTRYGVLTGRYYWRTPKKHSLEKDPLETRNLATDPAYRKIVEQHQDLLLAFAAKHRDELVKDIYANGMAPRPFEASKPKSRRKTKKK